MATKRLSPPTPPSNHSNPPQSAVALPSSLDIIRVHAWSWTVGDNALLGFLLPLVVDVLDVESVNVAREVSEERETDVDEQVCAAAGHEVYSDGRY